MLPLLPTLLTSRTLHNSQHSHLHTSHTPHVMSFTSHLGTSHLTHLTSKWSHTSHPQVIHTHITPTYLDTLTCVYTTAYT